MNDDVLAGDDGLNGRDVTAGQDTGLNGRDVNLQRSDVPTRPDVTASDTNDGRDVPISEAGAGDLRGSYTGTATQILTEPAGSSNHRTSEFQLDATISSGGPGDLTVTFLAARTNQFSLHARRSGNVATLLPGQSFVISGSGQMFTVEAGTLSLSGFTLAVDLRGRSDGGRNAWAIRGNLTRVSGP